MLFCHFTDFFYWFLFLIRLHHKDDTTKRSLSKFPVFSNFNFWLNFSKIFKNYANLVKPTQKRNVAYIWSLLLFAVMCYCISKTYKTAQNLRKIQNMILQVLLRSYYSYLFLLRWRRPEEFLPNRPEACLQAWIPSTGQPFLLFIL